MKSIKCFRLLRLASGQARQGRAVAPGRPELLRLWSLLVLLYLFMIDVPLSFSIIEVSLPKWTKHFVRGMIEPVG